MKPTVLERLEPLLAILLWPLGVFMMVMQAVGVIFAGALLLLLLLSPLILLLKFAGVY